MDHCSSLPTSNIQSSIEVFRFYTFALLSSAETFKLDALKMKLLKTDIRNLVVDVTKFCEENKITVGHYINDFDKLIEILKN